MKEYHITNDPGAGHLKHAFPDLKTLNRIIYLSDDLSIGPIKNLTTFIGRVKRKIYWMKVFKGSEWNGFPNISDYKKLKQIKKLLKKGDHVVIWAGPNSQAELRMLFLVALFKKYYKQIKIIQFPKQKIKSKYSCFSLGACGGEVAKKLVKLKKPLLKKDVARLNLIWKILQNDNSQLRKRKSKFKYQNIDETYIDNDILEICTNKFRPVGEVVGQIIDKYSFQFSIDFILYRIRQLIENKRLMLTGNFSSMRMFKVKSSRSLSQ